MCEIARKAGFPVLEHMSWHWLRRIFATRFIERFPDKMAVLIKLLGHSNQYSVHRYIYHSEAWMDEQIRMVMENSKKWPYIGNWNVTFLKSTDWFVQRIFKRGLRGKQELSYLFSIYRNLAEGVRKVVRLRTIEILCSAFDCDMNDIVSIQPSRKREK